MSELKVNTISANTEEKTTVDDALVVNETLEVTGVVTLSNLSPAGYVVNDASGILSTVETIAVAGLPTGIPAENIEDGSISGEEFLTLNGINTATTIQAQIDAIGTPAAGTPIGSIVMWATETPPTGWLECNGAELDTTGTYADLYGVVERRYTPTSVVAGKFRIPDLRGLFVRGWNHNRSPAVDPDTGARVARPDGQFQDGTYVGTTQPSEFKSHSHSASSSSSSTASTNAPVNNNSNLGVSSGGSSVIPYDGVGASVSVSTTTYTYIAAAGASAYETRPVNIALMYIIKAE